MCLASKSLFLCSCNNKQEGFKETTKESSLSLGSGTMWDDEPRFKLLDFGLLACPELVKLAF